MQIEVLSLKVMFICPRFGSFIEKNSPKLNPVKTSAKINLKFFNIKIAAP